MPLIKKYRAIADSDIPAAIARDTELITALAAHTNATDPHPAYLTQGEGDAKYRLNSTAFFNTTPFPLASIAGNSIAFSWNSVEAGYGTAELCNYAGLGGGDAFNFFRMPGYAATSPTISNRIARIDLNGGYIQTSDKRVKTDFSQAPGLNVILALSPQKYQHWECLGVDEKKSLKLGKNFKIKIGFVAQDLQKTLPEAVAETRSEEELYGIDYSVIVACAVKAIQELEAQVQEVRLQLQAISKSS